MNQRGRCSECAEWASTWVEDPLLGTPVWRHINCEPGARAQLVALDGTSGNVDHLMHIWGQRQAQPRKVEPDPVVTRVRQAIERVRYGEEHPPTWFVGVGMTRRDLDVAVREGWLINVGRGYFARVA